jgi:hypothetical protein
LTVTKPVKKRRAARKRPSAKKGRTAGKSRAARRTAASKKTRASKKSRAAMKSSSRPRSQRTKAQKKSITTAPPQSSALEQRVQDDQVAYVETLIQTGQAAPLTSEGKLPEGATHEIIQDDDGQVTVVRRRFSIT